MNQNNLKMFFRNILEFMFKFINNTITVILLIVLTMNVYMIIAKNVFNVKFPSFFGFSNAIVASGSMSNSMNVNDIIVIHKQNKYSVGDIISFKGENHMVTHRIIGVDMDGFITKGDANEVRDTKAVPASDVIGKVIFVIPKIGRIISYFS